MTGFILPSNTPPHVLPGPRFSKSSPIQWQTFSATNRLTALRQTTVKAEPATPCLITLHKNRKSPIIADLNRDQTTVLNQLIFECGRNVVVVVVFGVGGGLDGALGVVGVRNRGRARMVFML